MGKRCVWGMAIGLVLLGGAWNSAVRGAAADLTKLKSLCVISEKLSADAMQDHSLSKEAITNHVYVWLKGKLPGLRVERFTGAYTGACSVGKPRLFISVNIETDMIGRKKIGYFGAVNITMTRVATWETGSVSMAIAYSAGKILTGPMGKAGTHVNRLLEEILTDFAAEYYKAGNP